MQSAAAMPRSIGARTLATIRWVALAGQFGTIMLVHFALGFDVPMPLAIGCVGASVLLNVILQARAANRERIGDREATAYQAFDILQLSALLYVTGGLENPFALLLLAPVTVSATILSRKSTINLCVLALICTTGLASFHLPLPWRGEAFSLPETYVAGIWAAIVVALVFNASYAWWVAEEARQMSAALAATQDALAREQRLAAIGGLAAAAAHELGSPLGTIAVAAKELARELPPDSDLAEDARLLVSESERCREILASLARRPEPEADSPFATAPLDQLVEEAAAPYHRDAVTLIVEAHEIKDGPAGDEDDAEFEDPAPEVPRTPEILHGLGLLAQNAIQFATRTVEITVEWRDDLRRVVIEDDGRGFSDAVLPRLGEPYLGSLSVRSSRGSLGRGTPGRGTPGRRGQGLGLGVFIAKTLLERTGARLAFMNRVEGGARVVIEWPGEIAAREMTGGWWRR